MFHSAITHSFYLRVCTEARLQLKDLLWMPTMQKTPIKFLTKHWCFEQTKSSQGGHAICKDCSQKINYCHNMSKQIFRRIQYSYNHVFCLFICKTNTLWNVNTVIYSAHFRKIKRALFPVPRWNLNNKRSFRKSEKTSTERIHSTGGISERVKSSSHK